MPSSLKLNKLIIISKTVLEYYEHLLMLELDNKKGSEEFEKELSKLEEFIEYEEKLLSELTPNEWEQFIEELSGKVVTRSRKINDTIDIVLTNDKSLLSFQRLIVKLKERELKSLSSSLKNATPEEYSCDTEEELNHMKRIAAGTTVLYQTLQEDVAFLLISILNNEIAKETDLKVKKDLIMIKYKLAYIYPSLETRLLENKFSIKGEIYFSSDVVSSFYRLPSTAVEHVKFSFANQVYINSVEGLLTIKNEDYTKDNLELIIRELFLRASLQLLEADQIKKIQDAFIDLTEDNPDFIGLENGIELIEHALKKYQTDRKLINKVTLG